LSGLGRLRELEAELFKLVSAIDPENPDPEVRERLKRLADEYDELLDEVIETEIPASRGARVVVKR